MTTIINGSSPSITFSDSTTQTTAFNGQALSASPYTTALGASTLVNNTGTYNTAVGYQAGAAITTATRCTFVGGSAASTTTASDDTGIGYGVLGGTSGGVSGGNNIAVGSFALTRIGSGAYNTAIGVSSLQANTTASNNTAVGYQAGYNTTTGTDNTFVGWYAGRGITTGTYNTFIGDGAGNAITTGGKNVIIGTYNGNFGGLDIRTSSNYIVLSDGDGNPRIYWTNTGHAVSTCSENSNDAFVVKNTGNSTPYGIDVVFSITPNNTTNYFFQGEDSTNNKIAIYSSGTVTNRTGTYNAFSDIKLKQDIKDATSQWNDIKAIRFRKYRLIDDVKANPDAPYLMGVVAQELQQTSPNLIDECVDKEGEVTLGVKQSIIFMKAAKALQEAMERIETLEAKVTALEAK